MSGTLLCKKESLKSNAATKTLELDNLRLILCIQELELVLCKHDLLHTKEGLLLNVGVWVHHQPHHQLLASQICAVRFRITSNCTRAVFQGQQ